jgi:polyisoprenoid-binding protein YceI
MTTPTQLTSTELQERLKAGSLAGNWTVDPARSSVSLHSKSVWGLVKVKGSLGDVGGRGTVSPEGDLTGEITVATAALDTKNAKRDKHLRSEEMLSSEKHPVITFAVASVSLADGAVTVAGTLTVRDQSRPLTFPATIALEGSTALLDATVQVDRSEFGITWNQLGMASMINDVTIHAVFTKS